jgi:3-phosphoshikimate 1-carboxyvinyltransferase
MKQVFGLESLRGVISMPPDKSIAHRSAMFAALASGISIIENYSLAADPQTTLSCLRQLGVEIEQKGSTVTVYGVGRNGLRKPDTDIDCGNSGTTVRLLIGILAGAGIQATLVGDESLSGRPMKRVTDPLRLMGAQFEARESNYLPLSVLQGPQGGLKPMVYDLPIPSAQVKSCVLLAGLFCDEPVTVIERILSRDHTERLFDLPVEVRDGVRFISTSRATPLPLQNYAVPGDFSAAAFWLVAGSIYPKSEITLQNTGINETRTAAMHILQRMGADITVSNLRSTVGEPVADLVVRSVQLKATDISPSEVPNCIDELPILSVAMAFADGVSTFRGAEDLRHKESDRLAAVAAILRNAGVKFEEHADGLTIYGNPEFVPAPAVYESLHDHRIAMSAAVMGGLSRERSSVKDASCTAISYPGFWDDLSVLSLV